MNSQNGREGKSSLALTSCNLLEDPSEYDGKLAARTDVPLRSFYKDLFLDGGIRATLSLSPPGPISGPSCEMAALLRYARDGQGTTKPKCILHRGETIVMDKYSTDLDPSPARSR